MDTFLDGKHRMGEETMTQEPVQRLTMEFRPRVGAVLVVMRVDGDGWTRTIERRLRERDFEEGFIAMLDEVQALVLGKTHER
jgi:hypothetical protein